MSFKVVEYIDSLVDVGIDQKQAKAMANGIETLIESHQVSKADFITKEHLDSRIKDVIIKVYAGLVGVIMVVSAASHFIIDYRMDAMDQKISTLETSMDQKISTLETSMDQRIAALERSIDETRELVKQNHVLIQKLIDYRLQDAQRQ